MLEKRGVKGDDAAIRRIFMSLRARLFCLVAPGDDSSDNVVCRLLGIVVPLDGGASLAKVAPQIAFTQPIALLYKVALQFSSVLRGQAAPHGGSNSDALVGILTQQLFEKSGAPSLVASDGVKEDEGVDGLFLAENTLINHR